MVVSIPHKWEVVMPRRTTTGEDPGPLSRLLKRLRAERRLTQVQVADLAGWSGNSYYSYLERGSIRTPGKEKVMDLARAFEVSPDVLEAVIDRDRHHALQEESCTYNVLGGQMEIDYLPDRIVIRAPRPSVRRIVEHVDKLSERAQLSLERTLIDLREQEAELAEEQEVQSDTRDGTKDSVY